jgi:hypothetical protein
MTFTTWAALGVIKQPPLLLGLAFSLLVPLGMAMIGVGLYFVGSLFLPAKIEAARALFAATANEGSTPIGQDRLGVPWRF